VYRAWDEKLDREVALKLLPARAPNDGQPTNPIIEEGRVWRGCVIPNVVTLYGADLIDGHVGLWMERVSGRTLEAIVGDGRKFTRKRWSRSASSSPAPSAPCIAAGLVHRDIKASNVMIADDGRPVLGAGLALKLANVEVTWTAGSWRRSFLVSVSSVVVPWLSHRSLPPGDHATPEAAAFARLELERRGPVRGHEAIALSVFAGLGLLWATSGWHGLDVTFVALVGLIVLLLTGTLSWERAMGERVAWDVFIWYGGLLKMSELLNSTGVTKLFAESVGGMLGGLSWMTVLVLTLLIYFYAHYFFASITAHLLAMFPPFVALLIGVGVPPLLAVYSLMCLANLTAGLTHYGTTTGPVLYSQNYVTFGDWWRVGLIVSSVNLLIWLTIGFAWWKFLGFW
jgi:DASS family divalent anion:Na+ symporter